MGISPSVLSVHLRDISVWLLVKDFFHINWSWNLTLELVSEHWKLSTRGRNGHHEHFLFFSVFTVHVLTEHLYRNDHKFLDRQVWANSVNPDQTKGAIWSGSTVSCHSVRIFWMQHSTVKPHFSNFKTMTIFSGRYATFLGDSSVSDSSVNVISLKVEVSVNVTSSPISSSSFRFPEVTPNLVPSVVALAGFLPTSFCLECSIRIWPGWVPENWNGKYSVRENLFLSTFYLIPWGYP